MSVLAVGTAAVQLRDTTNSVQQGQQANHGQQTNQHLSQAQQQTACAGPGAGASAGAGVCGGAAAQLKRRYADAELNGAHRPKRARQSHQEATGATTLAYHAERRGLLTVLQSRFPGMSEAELAGALDACQNDVEQAILRIEQLCVSQQQQQQQQHGEREQGDERRRANGGGEGSRAAGGTDGDRTLGGASAGPATAPAGEQHMNTGEYFVELMVPEMTQAKDVTDARSRAGKVLRAFEAAVSEQVLGGGAGGAGGVGAAAAGAGAAREKQNADLLRDSAILKRALKIQMAKEQEREAEMAALRQQLESYKEQLARAELSNYSLAVHLREATTGGGAGMSGDMPHPDVF